MARRKVDLSALLELARDAMPAAYDALGEAREALAAGPVSSHDVTKSALAHIRRQAQLLAREAAWLAVALDTAEQQLTHEAEIAALQAARGAK